MKYDIIKKPKHYNLTKIEPLDVIEDWDLPYHLSNVIKYLARYKYKNGIEDLKKAEFYLSRYVKIIQSPKRTNRKKSK